MGSIARKAACAGALALATSVLWPTFAFATFHEMVVREAYPGSLAAPDSEYVELQMWSAGQTLVKGHTVTVYDATGAPSGSATFGGNVSNGVNQSTLIAATPAAESEFGINADATLTSGWLDPAGGAACWESLDCVSWGSFSRAANSPTGQPADGAGIPDGMAIRRTIAPDCATLLEEADDTNNSAVDFADAFPEPATQLGRAERSIRCAGGRREEAGAVDAGRPDTLRRKPLKKTHDRTPTFRFALERADSSFECKLDGKPYRVCHSPFTTPKLALGRHTFRVRARDYSGNVDPSPASYALQGRPRSAR